MRRGTRALETPNEQIRMLVGNCLRLPVLPVHFCWYESGFVEKPGNRCISHMGGFLLLGAIASFLVVGFARHYFASSHPEQFLNVWQRKAERQKSNPLMYLARNTEFIIRRCFLPYALLTFAVLNLIRLAFIGSAVGANLVWIIALYSYWKVSRPPHTAPAFSSRTHRARGKARTILAAH